MITIPLNGRTHASLDWTKARQQAIGDGPILWELDLGLFGELKRPIDDQTQFLSLALSLEHFRDTLWKEFADRTHSVCLYVGSADFSRQFPWTDKQRENLQHWLQTRGAKESPHLIRLFCRDTCVEYIQLLANRMPDGMNISVKLCVDGLDTVLEEAQLLTRERFERLTLVIEGSSIITTPDARVAICLPPMDMCRGDQNAGLEEGFQHLIRKKIPYRVIPENHLITEWDGLDYLLVTPCGLSPQGRRKLQGFAAAGGIVVSVTDSIGLPEEIQLKDF